MDYELALKLKKAGFPQGSKVAIPKDSGQIDEDGNLIIPEPVYLPTLSELIEACGPMFYALRHGQQAHKWTADARYPFPTKNGNHLKRRTKSRTGNTPEEAVARLYLAIHTPKPEQTLM